VLAIRALLVDDESPAREELKFLLRAYPDFFVAGEAEDGVAALKPIGRESRISCSWTFRSPESRA